MKRANNEQNIDHTVEREALWHALTPQMFRTTQLMRALSDALAADAIITDEASALEWAGFQPALVQALLTILKSPSQKI
ncbi:2-C-methyl-D-erythritol 4-phosphate cytidylyltransferase [Vibrio ponticus]|nr:2-C-methyl-D-erythritol 4-phosphate cytidylyltransferase [Vibrio ponticus]